MNNPRYHRQELVSGWNQDLLTKSRVALIGSGTLSDLTLIDLLSIGVGNIVRVGYSDFFDFSRINPDVNLEQRDEEPSSFNHAWLMIEGSEFIIDTTNHLGSKLLYASVANNKKVPYMSASSTQSRLSFTTEIDSGKLSSFHQDDMYTPQGLTSSVICSGVLTDELRKRIMPLGEQSRLENFVYSGIEERRPNGRIVQIGAGAIGTFSGLILALLGSELTIVDFDNVEETNLNRQFLFYDSVGKNKAEALIEKIGRYSIKLKAVNAKINQDFNPTGYEMVLSCVDNNQARLHMNQASSKYKIPLVNGGSSVSGGNAMPYFPGKTSCLDCQMGTSLSGKVEKESRERLPGECFQPSLIISNQIVAGLMINSLSKALTGKYEKSNYVSGVGIFNENVPAKCFDDCTINK